MRASVSGYSLWLSAEQEQTHLFVGDHTSQHELGNTNNGGGGDFGLLLL